MSPRLSCLPQNCAGVGQLGSVSLGAYARDRTSPGADLDSSWLFSPYAVAEPLIERGHMEVPIGKGKYKIKISPCMCGDISNLQVRA